MNTGAPTCSTCGGVNTNPQATQCRFCGQALAPQAYAAPHAFGAPQAYAPPHAFGAPPPGGYGVPAAHGQPPQPYGAPYGAPQPGGYGAHPPVQAFRGAQPFQGHGFVSRSGWASGWSTLFWVRLVVAAIAVGLSLLGACVSAIGH